MKPVICFYETETYVYSTDYLLLRCADSQPVTDFLISIEAEYAEQMKVIQIDFDAFASEASVLPALYRSPKAQVFVLKNYQVLALRDIQLKHTDLLRDSTKLLANTHFELLVSKNQFLQRVEKIRSWIAAGRLYQANLTAPFQAALVADSLQFFLLMQSQFKGAYKCYLPNPEFSIISFSPELFLAKTGERLVTAPIKGSLSSDKNSQSNLLENAKEDAELSMIVDLLRNDFNSLETESSAKVTSHRQLMSLNYIQHTYSEIEIKTMKNLPAILEKMMPGGSISGCPKKESLLVIGELETTQRQAYTGTMGWWHKDNFKLNVAIRTFVANQENYLYYAGCGIVYDSDAEKEFAELIDKAGKLNVHYS